MKILAIETSCDDTGIAIVEVKNNKIQTLANVLSSQEEIHKKWGGIHPSEAKREHQKNLFPAFKKAVSESKFLKKGSREKPPQIDDILSRETELKEPLVDFFNKNDVAKLDAVAVTVGPGLEPCLYVGVNFARALSLYLNIPLIPVNHIKAHLLFFLKEKKEISFPVIALVISGGHTELVLMKSLSSFELIGKTRDDAAGECLDKTARILNLGYPGGPAISKEAEKCKKHPLKDFNINLPRPMMHADNFDFSFSGLKTAVLYDFQKRSKKEQSDKEYITCMAKEIENTVIDVIISKLKKATKKYNAKTVILGGGVTANKSLRRRISKIKEEGADLEILFPPLSLSTDNDEMIAIASSVEKAMQNNKKIIPNANLKLY